MKFSIGDIVCNDYRFRSERVPLLIIDEDHQFFLVKLLEDFDSNEEFWYHKDELHPWENE